MRQGEGMVEVVGTETVRGLTEDQTEELIGWSLDVLGQKETEIRSKMEQRKGKLKKKSTKIAT